MAKYKNYNYSQQVLIPVSLEEQILPGTLEFAIHTLIETRMDMSVFDGRYHNDETGRLAYDPKILLKVVLFGYSRGLISSRAIERACKENIIFMALSCGEQPDHSTIATFVSSMKDEIVPLFRDVLLVCEEMDLLGGSFFALDGCKLPSNASKQWSGRISELRRKQDKLVKKLEQLIAEQVEADKDDDEEGKGGSSPGLLDRSKQIDRLQKHKERISRWLGHNSPKIGRQGREIKSNITDNESATMKTSHGTIQGYNGQALVDSKHQVIVHAEAFGEGQDQHHIPPMLDGAKENMEAIGYSNDYFKGKSFVADSNYNSPKNLKRCKDECLDAYIPDKNFRGRDPRFATQDRWKPKQAKRFTLESFHYNETADQYVCPHGKILRLRAKKTIVDGIIYRRYGADEEACKGCTLRLRCCKGKKGRLLNVPIGPVPGNLTKEMAEKVDTQKGRKLYHQRIAIVEPVFANIRYLKGLTRFTLRGKIKVNIQWLLYCMVHNVGKIANYGFT